MIGALKRGGVRSKKSKVKSKKLPDRILHLKGEGY